MALSALDFTRSLRDSGYGFATDKEATAARLREIADAIESGEVLPQSVRITSLAKNDDFTFTSVRLVIAEKHPKKLYGSDARGFPAAVAAAETKEA